VLWCIDGANYDLEPNRRRHYSRVYDNGRSWVHVITSADGNALVSCWIRGRLDPGV